ncbi:hypothetical protein C1893_11945 [Pseudomonas sp. MPR-ANC1]|uniref:Cap15 family cyclic dinucleotide receptor domain-containing protein n=1 Tax=Pseudomonas sp. MPR-ANC1 TaxID=2075548 RepID=UPI000CD2BF43|nr:hypothetical protein [Pseudomonas sp. MPR-ANC1]POA48185.1 hypothetical protein C1893_11945 [Pseudomonas sp. MPR-ANC1]
MQPHEYSIIGHSRAMIGRYLAIFAGLASSAIAAVVALSFDIAQKLELTASNPGVIVLPISAAVIYTFGHALFDSWMWRWPLILKLLKIPNLNGTWNCKGQTINSAGEVTFDWSATIRITQTWEKLRIYLNTGQSKSASIAASLVHEPGRGYILMYSYRNEPRAGEVELKSHIGYAELELNESLTEAYGDYFNNKGRLTCGRMILTRQGD